MALIKPIIPDFSNEIRKLQLSIRSDDLPVGIIDTQEERLALPLSFTQSPEFRQSVAKKEKQISRLQKAQANFDKVNINTLSRSKVWGQLKKLYKTLKTPSRQRKIFQISTEKHIEEFNTLKRRLKRRISTRKVTKSSLNALQRAHQRILKEAQAESTVATVGKAKINKLQVSEQLSLKRSRDRILKSLLPQKPVIDKTFISSRITGRWQNDMEIKVNDYVSVSEQVKNRIRALANNFRDKRIAISATIESEDGQTPITGASRKIKKIQLFDLKVDRLLGALDSLINRYEDIWSSEAGMLVSVKTINVEVRLLKNSRPPRVRNSQSNVNCLLDCIYKQTKLKSAYKESVSLSNEYIDNWDELEQKFNVRIQIVDTEGDIWRYSERKLKRRKYRQDVIIKIHNYHVEPCTTRERMKFFTRVKSIELDQRLIDGVWHAKKKEIKSTEEQDKKFTNVNKKSKKAYKNVWISREKLDKKYQKLSQINGIHVIENQDDIIGLIVPAGTPRNPFSENSNSRNLKNSSFTVSTHYKIKDAFRNLPSKIGSLTIIDYKKTNAWSLSSYIRNKFKKYLINKYDDENVNSEFSNSVLHQIPNEKIYNLCSKNQRALGRVFTRRLRRVPSVHNNEQYIHQIDANQSYKNTSIGNIPDQLKKYFHGFPRALRNVKTFSGGFELSSLGKQTVNNIFNNYYGNAIIKYDQSILATNNGIPTWFNGNVQLKGVQYVSIPVMKYMFDLGIKIHLYQLHYSKKSCNPFTQFMSEVDKTTNILYDDIENSSCQEECIEKEQVYKSYRMLPNMLIGGLNRKINKSLVIRTFSKEEFDRAIIKRKEKGDLIVKFTSKIFDGKDDSTPNSRNLKNSSFTGNEPIMEYCIHYQEKENIHNETFNMVHWSKYVIDYQKIVMHHMTKKVCCNDIRKLGCINTDSITYLGKLEYNKHFHIEVFNMDEAVLVSNGLRYLESSEGEIYQRHSGYTENLTKEKFIDLLDKIPPRENMVSSDEIMDNNFLCAMMVEEYDIKNEDIVLENQKLIATIAPAGYGKTEIVKYMIGQKSKYNPQTHISKKINTGVMFRKYKAEEFLSCCPTHQSRKMTESKNTITNSALKFSLKYYSTSKLKVEKLKAIIFDEVSMMDGIDLKHLDNYLRLHLRNRPFGGLDIYLFGDFKQLPPWKGEVVPKENLLFNSELYKTFEQCTLNTNYRQKDQPILQDILTKIRDYYEYGGDKKSEHKGYEVLRKILTKEEIGRLNKNFDPGVEKIRQDNILCLCHSNKDRYDTTDDIYGELKIGSDVVFRKTFKNRKSISVECSSTFTICNGDFGKVEGFRAFKTGSCFCKAKNVGVSAYLIKHEESGENHWFESKYFKEPCVKDNVYLSTDKTLTKKYPDIHLNYASTVHCVQGRTVDKILFSPKDLSINLLYVAITRATNIDGIYLSDIL